MLVARVRRVSASSSEPGVGRRVCSACVVLGGVGGGEEGGGGRERGLLFPVVCVESSRIGIVCHSDMYRVCIVQCIQNIHTFMYTVTTNNTHKNTHQPHKNTHLKCIECLKPNM